MKLQTLSQSLATVPADWLVLGVFDGDRGVPASLSGTPLAAIVAKLVASKDLPGDVGDSLPLHGLTGLAASSVLLVGFGKKDEFDAGAAFEAGVAAAKTLASKKRNVVAVGVEGPAVEGSNLSALVAGLIVGTRGPGLRKSEPGRHEFETLTLVVPEESGSLEKAVNRGQILGEAVNLARELANLPPAEKTPTSLAARAEEVAKAAGLKSEVWDEDRIRSERFGGLLGVAAGSEEAPAFVILEHRKGGAGPTLALVGKGVTFDSGGLSLKPSASMEDMKCDMTGAAVVLATMQAAARLDLPVNLRGYLVLTENMPGRKAMKLGDVLTMRNGKTVEVLNTDAEGRLILADALSYAAEGKPARILDLATLTGACMVALGTKVAGLFSNDDGFTKDVLAASKVTGERAWRMPLDNDYRELLKSQVADLKNVGGKWGGSITAAKFLQEFVAETPWVHLDIAGPSWADSDGHAHDAGGTGCFVRTLIELIETSGRTG